MMRRKLFLMAAVPKLIMLFALRSKPTVQFSFVSSALNEFQIPRLAHSMSDDQKSIKRTEPTAMDEAIEMKKSLKSHR